jgi:hypothetical protein
MAKDLGPEGRHRHDDRCYTVINKCGKREHGHGAVCYRVTHLQVCDKHHRHADRCFRTKRVLECIRHEHAHTPGCFQQKLVCGR